MPKYHTGNVRPPSGIIYRVIRAQYQFTHRNNHGKSTCPIGHDHDKYEERVAQNFYHNYEHKLDKLVQDPLEVKTYNGYVASPDLIDNGSSMR